MQENVDQTLKLCLVPTFHAATTCYYFLQICDKYIKTTWRNSAHIVQKWPFLLPVIVDVNQSCEWNDKSANRERESRTRIGSDATFFWDSLSNLVIDDNFRISNNLGLGLAANISTALPIQPDRDLEIEIV